MLAAAAESALYNKKNKINEKKRDGETMMEEDIHLIEDVEKRTTTTGMIHKKTTKQLR